MDPDWWNSPNTCSITLEVMGYELQFAQDPNSKHFRNHCLGCINGVSKHLDYPWVFGFFEYAMKISESFGSLRVAELDWGNEDHIRAVEPPFDYVIGTDVVYAEQLLEPLLRTIVASYQSQRQRLCWDMRYVRPVYMRQCFRCGETTSTSKPYQDPRNRSMLNSKTPSIHLCIMRQKSLAGSSADAGLVCSHEGVDTSETKQEAVEIDGSNDMPSEGEEPVVSLKEDSIFTRLREGKLSDWETRRSIHKNLSSISLASELHKIGLSQRLLSRIRS